MKGKINLKTIIVFAILILVIVLSVLGIGAAKTFISGATVGYEPTELVALPNETGKTATISWKTDKSVKASVFYGTNMASLLLMAEDTQPTDSHSILLTNLKSDTTYYYKIVIDSDNIFDNGGIMYNFKTGGKVDDPLLPTTTLNPSITIKPSSTVITPTTIIPSIRPSISVKPSIADIAPVGCNRTTDYDKSGGKPNNMDYIYCMKGKVTPTIVDKCAIGQNGITNVFDRKKCLTR